VRSFVQRISAEISAIYISILGDMTRQRDSRRAVGTTEKNKGLGGGAEGLTAPNPLEGGASRPPWLAPLGERRIYPLQDVGVGRRVRAAQWRFGTSVGELEHNTNPWFQKMGSLVGLRLDTSWKNIRFLRVE